MRIAPALGSFASSVPPSGVDTTVIQVENFNHLSSEYKLHNVVMHYLKGNHKDNYILLDISLSRARTSIT
ncbi:hypothetical protein ccbrp13_37320 [Ktedonobacteria bacterium brp13]|nr:hypothetical protein ccbrp13_37320 [Ktedonobacteria bacterium brp13]